MFTLWLEEEEEQWHAGRRLLSSCPAEFLCPISMDVMTEPVVLVGMAVFPVKHVSCGFGHVAIQDSFSAKLLEHNPLWCAGRDRHDV